MLIPTTPILLFFQNQTARKNFVTLAKFMVLLFVIVLIYSVLFHVIMVYEGREFTWITGVYWSLTVMTTLGFGDITFHTDLGRMFTMFVLLSGIIFMLVILPFTFIQFFYAPWLEVQEQARTPSKLPEEVRGHVIIAGLDPVTRKLVEQLRKRKYPYVVLAPDPHTAAELLDAGYKVVIGLPDDARTYINVGVERAAMVVATVDDLINTNISFTIREVCEKVPIVTNADKDHSVDILEFSGSMHVFQFMKMLGESLAHRTLGLSKTINVIASYDELHIGVAPAADSPLIGKRLFESGIREETGVIVVGIWEKGRLLKPLPDTVISAASILVLAGSRKQLDCFGDTYARPEQQFAPDSPVLILGGGRVGNAAAASLAREGIKYTIIEKRASLIHGESSYIEGDAADLETLKKAGIDKARSVIITTHNDDMNIYLTFYCRQLRQDVQIISRATVERSVSKLHRAGADLVMSYASMGAGAILNVLLPGQVSVFTDGLVVFNTPVPAKVAGKTIIESRIREKTGCSIVALRQGDIQQSGPEPGTVLQEGAELILVGTADAEKNFVRFANGQKR
ncbi:MAG: NAD-binding protein [Desulfopila sp.]|jgi:Trk K+ transport system NAD-binding subunit|nr:NAD-binding protein [Desulfopila sp.]